MLSSQYSISQVLTESFQENELLYIEVLISVEGNDLSSDLVDMISSVLMNFDSVNITGFQPSCKSQVPTVFYCTFIKFYIIYFKQLFYVCMQSS